MNTELKVFTFTKGNRQAWLDQCTQSVVSQLPPTASHEIVTCATYAVTDIQRRLCLDKAEFIAFVDDDDYIINDSLNKCLKAIKETGAGVAFTDELLVNANGEQLHKRQPVRSQVLYNSAYTQPLTIHHLTVIRTSAIPDSIKFSKIKLLSTIDWLFKAGAALNQGAVRIEEFGYCWRHHGEARHIDITEQAIYNENFNLMKEALLPYTAFKDQIIPVYKS